jgi:hypothetical protein
MKKVLPALARSLMRCNTEAPWEFSEATAPGEGYLNMPTPEGEALGKELARLADLAEAEQLKQFPNMLPRCNECAFRAGTLPNGCAETVSDALKCVIERVPFWCHKGLKEEEGQPTRICTGWMVSQAVAAKAEERR